MGWVCVALAAGLFTVGWWPFSFRPVNHASWLPDRAGLEFQPDGIAYDPERLPVPAQPAAYTVELWVKPGGVPATDIFHILTIDDGHTPPNLILCQWLSNLELRTRQDGGGRGYQEVGGREMLPRQTEQFVTVTSDSAETVFYEDGIEWERFPRPMLPAGGLSGRLILGDAAEGKHPWAGQLSGLAIFSRALAASEVAQHHAAWTNHLASRLASETNLLALYLFDGRQGAWAEDSSPNRHRIFIPARYEVLHKLVLTPPWVDFQPDWSELQDDVINVLGFVPFGFGFFLYRRMAVKERSLKSILFAVAVGASVSLVIELVQVWLPNRSSSSTDLIFNTLGTFIGVMLARRISSQSTKSNSTD
jgi:VanZ family protein